MEKRHALYLFLDDIRLNEYNYTNVVGLGSKIFYSLFPLLFSKFLV